MSSLTRRIQRTQPHKTPRYSAKRGWYLLRVAGRTGYMGRGSKLGVTNPKAKDLVARLARQVRRGVA